MIQVDYILDKARRSLPRELAPAPWQILDHGTKVLQSNAELDAYLVAYGEMHRIKLNAALQNFPYEKLPRRIHLIDWGCGQGFGALCFLDNLYIRGEIERVKKITLIEPSEAALHRAEQSIRDAMRQMSVTVETICKYLPSDSGIQHSLSSLEISLPGTVHIFSNILDIPSVSLRKTAQILERGQGKQFVICTSPINNNAPRLDEFSKYFSAIEVFSDIHEKDYGFTSDTCHKVSCKTKCFFFESSQSRITANVHEGHYTYDGAYDDYDLSAMVHNGLISQNLFKAYTTLSSHLYSSDRIFLKPHMNVETPDIIVVRPGKGILVFDIFEESLSNCSFDEKRVFKVGNRPSASPFEKAHNYRDSIFQRHSSELMPQTVKMPSTWYVVRPAVWFPKEDRDSIDTLFADSVARRSEMSPRNSISGVLTLSKDELDSPDLWDLLDMRRNRKSFTKAASDQFINLLKGQWHCFNEGDEDVVLTRKQKALVKSYPGRVKRVKGSSGSGKTQVLASTAVQCQLRTGRRVLILTFNITLANYIRYRIGRVPADFPWDKFNIDTYYNFFTAHAKNCDLKLSLASYTDTTFLNGVRDRLPKYSAILVDEAQDYQTEWFKILFDYFLEDDGEVVIFGDERQDIYKRNNFERVPAVRENQNWGPWSKLNQEFRVNNQYITEIAQAFKHEFFNEPYIHDAERELVFGGGVNYTNLQANCSPEDLAVMITDYVLNTGIPNKDVVVLSQTVDILREIDYYLRKSNNITCLTTFETKEVYDHLLKQPQNEFRQKIDMIRRFKKNDFTMDSDEMKISTIHSFKGWEAKCVILLLQEGVGDRAFVDNRPELIYTAITRAKDYLYVINLGNTKYHNFFQQQINDEF